MCVRILLSIAKKYIFPSHQADFSVRAPRGQDSHVEIQWNDLHTTKISLKWLRENCYSRATLEQRKNKQQPLLWDVPMIERRGGFPQFEYSEIMKDDKAVWEWVKAINTFGCALVVNGPTQEGTIAGLTERYGNNRNKNVIFQVFTDVSLLELLQNRLHSKNHVWRHL